MDRKADRSRIVVNGHEGPEFNGRIGRPSLSRDGRVMAYWVMKDDAYFIRIGDREEPAYDFVTHPVVSADGSTVAFACERDGRWFLHVGAENTPLGVRPPQALFISADGRHVGWIETLEISGGGTKMRVVALEEAGAWFDIVSGPVFDPTGTRVAYGAENGDRKFVVIGARRIETPDRAGDPVFSPDGRTAGYGARTGNELWWKVLNVP